jgi:hypothetical protein
MIAASNLLFGRIPAAAVATATLIGAAVQGLAKFVAPFWQLYVVMLVAWAIGGMGHGIKNTGFRTLIHLRVDAAHHGRAFAAFNGLRNTAETRRSPAGPCWSRRSAAAARCGSPAASRPWPRWSASSPSPRLAISPTQQP